MVSIEPHPLPVDYMLSEAESEGEEIAPLRQGNPKLWAKHKDGAGFINDKPYTALLKTDGQSWRQTQDLRKINDLIITLSPVKTIVL